MSIISELVQKLRRMAFFDIGGVGKTLNQAADTIEELSAKVARQNMERSSQYYGGGWIPCSERMPKETGSYIVTIYLSRISGYIADIDHFVYNGYEPDGGYWVNCEDNKEVLAWQPLPPAYEPKED